MISYLWELMSGLAERGGSVHYPHVNLYYFVYHLFLLFSQDEEGWEYLEEDQALYNYKLPNEVREREREEEMYDLMLTP